MTDITGTVGDDTLYGTGAADTILGLDGADRIYGGDGDDRIEGGEGFDSLDGEGGSDILLGGGYTDYLSDSGGGDDQLFGGAGQDQLTVSRYRYIFGDGAPNTILLDGGDDQDIINFFAWTRFADIVTIRGGSGDDFIQVQGGATVDIDAGSGNDRVSVDNGATQYRISLGTGADILSIAQHEYDAPGTGIVVTDFEAGDAGDTIDILFHLVVALDGWDQHTNPFATGHLRLVQQGAHSVVQIDRNGGGDAFTALITLEGVAMGSLTPFNLGGYGADGAPPPPRTIAGTALDDDIAGTIGDDTISGLGGNDRIEGGAGNDRIDGGEGYDSLEGGLGSDVLIGGGTAGDYLRDTLGGDDQLYGGDGNDRITVERMRETNASTVLIDAGGGDDSISFSSEGRYIDTAVIRAGDGNDVITVDEGLSFQIDAGAGDDRLRLDIARSTHHVTLGAGADVVTPYGYLVAGGVRGIVIADFDTAEGGDSLRMIDFLDEALANWDGETNPFATGHLRLVDEAGGARLEVDRNGGGDGYETLITFEGVAAESLTARHLGGYHWDGSPPPGETITGTAAGDRLSGTGGGDTIYGLAGNDTITGGGGDDVIYGGEGYDSLNGELGDDVLIGGGIEGDGFSDSHGGNDQFFGGSGSDYLWVNRVWYAPKSVVLLDAAGGNDTIVYRASSWGWDEAVIRGGDGQDRITVSQGGLVEVDAGAGDDRIFIEDAAVLLRLTLGAGADVLGAEGSARSWFGTVVTDFEAGAGGDRIEFPGYMADTVSQWDPAADAFQTGHLRLAQQGAHTVVQFDRDGSGADYGFATLMVLENLSASTLTAFNLGGYAPGRIPRLGDEGANALTGTSGADILIGMGGDDVLDGGGGIDRMEGGSGNDFYVVEATGDVVVETAGAGTDTVRASVGYTLGDHVENLVLTGTVAINGTGNALANRITGNGGANALWGLAGNDRLDGGAGADRLSGGDGDDVYIVDDAGDRVLESSATGGHDIVFSSVSFSLTYQQLERLELTGTASIDGTGNSLNNTLVGNGGANVLDGGIGVDVMGGRGGDDTYIVDHVGDSVIESAGGGTDTVLSHVTFHLSRSYEIETLTLVGSSAVNAYGNHLNNRLEGNDNNNILNGSAGADTMAGRKGTDTYYVDDAGDVVIELANEGVDTVRSSVSYALGDHVENLGLEGSADIDATGNALNNRLSGNHGANRLDGGAGADVMNGYRGDDIYIVDNIGDVVQEFDPLGGNDTVLASVSYRLSGTQVETLQLTGNDAIDATGHNAANTLIGNDAANRLYGKLGNDVLQGGGGADGFMFDTALSATSNVDTILDFSVADDTIHLSRSVFGDIAANGTLAASAFRAGTAAQDADDRIVYDSATGSIFYDADGSGAGAAVLFATVTAGTALTHLDFSVYTPG